MMRPNQPEHPMPLCVFDIHPDGTATRPEDSALDGPGRYRWWHYDLSDPALPGWIAATLDPIPGQALLQAETRPRCDPHGDGLILNLRGINLNEGQPAEQMVSVRMWVTASAIVTVRLRKVFALDRLRRRIEDGDPPATVPAFIEALIRDLTDRIQDEVGATAKLTEFFEADLEDSTTAPPSDLPVIRRRVIRLRRYLEPQRTAIHRLSISDQPIFGPGDLLELRELANRTTIAVEELDALRERLVAVQDEHEQITARAQARHGLTLSIAAAVFLPLGFLTGLFGVNIAGMPGLENPLAFTFLCLALIFLALGMIVLIRWLRWV